jgi:hypothetical protein
MEISTTTEPRCVNPGGHKWLQDDVGAGAGTVLIIDSHCSKCGVRKRHRAVGEFPPNPDDRDSTTYTVS